MQVWVALTIANQGGQKLFCYSSNAANNQKPYPAGMLQDFHKCFVLRAKRWIGNWKLFDTNSAIIWTTATSKKASKMVPMPETEVYFIRNWFAQKENKTKNRALLKILLPSLVWLTNFTFKKIKKDKDQKILFLVNLKIEFLFADCHKIHENWVLLKLGKSPKMLRRESRFFCNCVCSCVPLNCKFGAIVISTECKLALVYTSFPNKSA